ncbi:MAG: hypothetical protein FWC26_07645 [Fibromonadales bacterium]|nr:hypothetical protein [Fibromonadales bacterium]
MSDEDYDLKRLHELVLDSLSGDAIKARCVLGGDKRVLRDYEDFERRCGRRIPLIRWMGNLMTLAGAFLYVKFNQWRTETGAHPTDKERPNALYLKRLLAGVQSTSKYFNQASSGLRILRVLDGLYNNFDMNFLVIKHLVINLQIEAGFNFQGKGGLSKLVGFPHEKSLRIRCSSDEFEKDGQNLAAAFNFVSVCRSDPNLEKTYDTDKYKIDEVKHAFKEVFKTMEFMKRVKLKINSNGDVDFIETTSSGEKIIPSHGVVRAFETDNNAKITGSYNSESSSTGFCLLERIEYLSDNTKINAAVKLLYQSFDESDSVSVYFSEREDFVPEDCAFPISLEESVAKSAAGYFKNVSGYLPSKRSTTRGIIAVHFRYFNILAPSIVDAIDTDLDAKKRVLQKFVKEEKVLFEEALEPAFKILESALESKLGKDFSKEKGWSDKIDKLCEYISSEMHRDANNEYNFRTVVDWDMLMLRILIYEGPSEILKTVLLSDKKDWVYRDFGDIEDTCKKIIAGLEMRYIDNVFEASEVADKQKKYYEKIIKPKVEKLKKYDCPQNYFYKMECKMLVQSYIDVIISELTRICEDGMEKCQNELAENSIQDKLEILEAYKEDEYSKAYKTFLETVKVFLSFYAGILESCGPRMSYVVERSASILKPVDIENYRIDIEKKFFVGVSEEISRISKLLHDVLNEDNAVEQALKELWKFAKASDKTRYYEAVLGRAPINARNLAKIFNVNDGKIIFIYNREEIPFEKAKKYRIIIKCLGNIMRFLAGFEMEMDEDSLSKSGEKNCDKGNYNEYVKMVIYPQVVTYAKKREDSDSNHCLIMKHSGVLADWHKGGVQILTEFKYDLNHSYYALPNLNSIEPEWWVDPILVSCNEFDEAIRKGSAKKESER